MVSVPPIDTVCVTHMYKTVIQFSFVINTLRTGDADLRFNTVKLGTSASSS